MANEKQTAFLEQLNWGVGKLTSGAAKGTCPNRGKKSEMSDVHIKHINHLQLHHEFPCPPTLKKATRRIPIRNLYVLQDYGVLTRSDAGS